MIDLFDQAVADSSTSSIVSSYTRAAVESSYCAQVALLPGSKVFPVYGSCSVATSSSANIFIRSSGRSFSRALVILKL